MKKNQGPTKTLRITSECYNENGANPLVEIFKETQQELGEMISTAEADAQEIYNLLVSPDCCFRLPNENPLIAMLNMSSLNLQISSKLNLHSLFALIQLDRKNTASILANKRHKPNRDAKNFVRNEWSMHYIAYGGNKSAFSRDYVKRVLHEFNLKVTEKQMREVWLADTPPAGKPDGMLGGR